MRRKDKEITDIDDIINIIHKCKVCRLGLAENNKPYIVPLNYGYEFKNGVLTLYFHSAKEGRKLDILKTNNHACFEVDCDLKLIEAENACNYGYAFRSVVGFGKMVFLERLEEIGNGLNIIMRHQTEKENIYNFSPDMLKNVTVYKMVVEEFTGKQKQVPA